MSAEKKEETKKPTPHTLTHTCAPVFGCPSCGSDGPFYRDGLRCLSDGVQTQRWLCRDCGYRFSEPEVDVNVFAKASKRSKPMHDLPHDVVASADFSFKESVDGLALFSGENVASHGRTVTGKQSNSFCDHNSAHQVCVKKKAKNLASTTETNTVAGETNRTIEEVKGKILELCIHLKRQNYSDETIRLNRIALKVLLDRGANLYDESSVKDVISGQKWSDNRTRNVINAYDMFVKLNGLSWNKPRCKVNAKIPFVPTEQEIDCLVSSAGKKLSTFLLLLKETAMRRGEAKRLQWIDLDSERCLVTLNAPEKNSNPRMWKVSPRLIAMLNALPKDNQRVFGNSKMDSMKSMFLALRKKQAFKLHNPRLLKVNFHSFRHWKATMLMHQTHADIYYVKQFLGHKSIKNTEVYLHVERTIFGESSDDGFTVKVAEKPQEVKELLELGFDYVCQKDNLIFLRKRK